MRSSWRLRVYCSRADGSAAPTKALQGRGVRMRSDLYRGTVSLIPHRKSGPSGHFFQEHLDGHHAGQVPRIVWSFTIHLINSVWLLCSSSVLFLFEDLHEGAPVQQAISRTAHQGRTSKHRLKMRTYLQQWQRLQQHLLRPRPSLLSPCDRSEDQNGSHT